MNTKSMLIAAGIGGVVMTILSGMPFLSCVNCLLCAGVWGSGILAVYVYGMSDRTLPRLSVGQGALLGLAAGVVGAFLLSIWGVISSLLFAGSTAAQYADMMKQLDSMGNTVPESYRGMIEQYASATGNVLVGTLCNFVIYPLFGMIGGLIGSGLIWKK